MPHKTCFKEGKRKHFGEIGDLHYVVALLNFFVIAQIFPQYPFFKIIEVEEKILFTSMLTELSRLICCLPGFQCYECAGAGGTCATEEDLGLVCILLYSIALVDTLDRKFGDIV